VRNLKKFKLIERRPQAIEQFQQVEEPVEENFQIPQNQKLDLQQKEKQEVLAEARVQEKVHHKLLFGFYFYYIFLRFLIF